MKINNKHNERLKKLEKGKTKPLGGFEKIAMKYAGWKDGKKGFLRIINGIWESCHLREEIDSYEEYSARLFGALKVEKEEEFVQLNILFDRIAPLRKRLVDAKTLLEKAEMENPVELFRKAGEEHLTETQLAKRRENERNKQLRSLHKNLSDCEEEVSLALTAICEGISRIKESFDSTSKICNRLLVHTQRRIDVYWRSAMHHIPNLPPTPDVAFSNVSEQLFLKHYNEMLERAEVLRKELETVYEGGI